MDGVLTNTKYNDKRKYPDDKLRKLISHFNSPRLRNSDLEKEEIFSDAYEYLLEEFAEQTKKRGGVFFTPREVVRLLVNLVEAKEGMSICDPTCGSAAILIESKKPLSYCSSIFWATIFARSTVLIGFLIITAFSAFNSGIAAFKASF